MKIYHIKNLKLCKWLTKVLLSITYVGGFGGNTPSSLLDIIDGGLFFKNSIKPILFSNEKDVPN